MELQEQATFKCKTGDVTHLLHLAALWCSLPGITPPRFSLLWGFLAAHRQCERAAALARVGALISEAKRSF